MLRLIGDTSFQTWWQCRNNGRIPNEQAATSLSVVGRHDHHSAVYQVLPEFRELYEFALGWIDTEESETSSELGTRAAAQPAEGRATRGDDNEYEQVDITSLLDAQAGAGELPACDDVKQTLASLEEQSPSAPADQESALENGQRIPSWWSVEPSRSAPEACGSEQGLLVALAASVDVLHASEAPENTLGMRDDSEPSASNVSTRADQQPCASGIPSNAAGVLPEPAEVPDELVEFLKVLCAPTDSDDSLEQTSSETDPQQRSDRPFVAGSTTSIWRELARKYSEQLADAMEHAKPTTEPLLTAPIVAAESNAVDSGAVAFVRRQGHIADEPVRTSPPLASELISYAPLTRDAIGIPLQRKPRSRQLGAMLGLSVALLGVVASLVYGEFGVKNLEAYEAAARGIESPNAIRSLAMLRVPQPTPVAFELLHPRPTIEPARVEAEAEAIAPPTDADSPPTQAAPSPRATLASAASAQSPARGPSASPRERQTAAKQSESPVPDEQPAPVTATFDTQAAERAISRAAEQAQACRDGVTPTGEAFVTVTFAPSGRVITTSVAGPPFAGTAAGSCIAAKLYDVRIQPFAATASVTLTRTLTIR